MAGEAVAVVEELFERMGRGDFATTGELFSHDVRFERFGAALVEGEVVGIEAFGAAIREWLQAFEDFRIVGERFVDLGDGRVLVMVRHRGTARGSGLPFERELADVLTVRDGRVTVYHSYWDRALGYQAVGLAGP